MHSVAPIGFVVVIALWAVVALCAVILAIF